MKAKEFEDVCLYRMRQEEELGRATMSRYGVQGNFIDGAWQPVQSLPDFEGLIEGGRQFITDCKVCGAASFPLDDDKFKRRQWRHMVTRSRFGAVCFLLIHFSERELKTRTEPAETWAFPVMLPHPFWNEFDAGSAKRITRQDCEEYAVKVEWNTLPGGRTTRPDVLAAVIALAQRSSPSGLELQLS